MKYDESISRISHEGTEKIVCMREQTSIKETNQFDDKQVLKT